jgi:hypothetical protein
LRSHRPAKVEKLPAKEPKPKTRLTAMVPAAPRSMEALPPMRSQKRPLTSWPVP